jgi:hypothetical protein
MDDEGWKYILYYKEECPKQARNNDLLAAD